jgi:hypothetical protein
MDPLFEVHMLNEEGKRKARGIAYAFDALLAVLEGGIDKNPALALCPPSRELSIVKTKLEEACFFAKKAMANIPENQAQ